MHACNLAQDVITCQQAVSDILASVSRDIYINQTITRFGAQEKQVGGTCYAHATAAVLHLAMKRIIGREGGYPDFDVLRDLLIGCYGRDGAHVEIVLKEVCPQYRLQFQKVDSKGAMHAVMSNRPVIATFYLTGEKKHGKCQNEWEIFSKFYKANPRGILTTKELDIRQRCTGLETTGHAVVLTSYDSKCLRLMNSWGTEWADDGFFSVQNAEVLGLKFFDVFWTLDDLTCDEKVYYDIHGPELAAKLMANVTGLQDSEFECPLCHSKSKVTQFGGRLKRARCPVCRREFRCGDAENILALKFILNHRANSL